MGIPLLLKPAAPFEWVHTSSVPLKISQKLKKIKCCSQSYKTALFSGSLSKTDEQSLRIIVVTLDVSEYPRNLFLLELTV